MNKFEEIYELIKDGWNLITVCHDKIELAQWVDENNKDKGYKLKTFLKEDE